MAAGIRLTTPADFLYSSRAPPRSFDESAGLAVRPAMRGKGAKRRRISFLWVGAVLFQLVSACTTPAAPPSVSVTKLPVRIEYRSYVAGHPPPGVVPSTESAVGICDAQFKTVAQCHALYPRLGVKTVTATVQTVEISLMLRVILWLSEGSGPEVREHEETHREIAEHYYAMGEEIGQSSGERVVGKRLTLSAKNSQQALEAALGGITQMIVDDVQRRLSERCSYAQQRFDAITDHGRNAIANEDARAQALAEESAHWATRYSGLSRGVPGPLQKRPSLVSVRGAAAAHGNP